MILRAPVAALAVALSTAAFAVPSQAVEYNYFNDRTTSPEIAAFRLALANEGREGGFLDKRDGAAIAEFYAARGHVPVWTADGKLTEEAVALAKRLRAADEDGLDPRAYPTPRLYFQKDAADLARAEIMLSHSILTYARHAYGGVVEPGSISRNLDYKAHELDPIAALRKVSRSDDALAALDSFNPQRPEFQALRERLAEVREDDSERPPFIPEGRYMKLGSKDKRVVMLRERFGLPTEVEEPTLFDETVDEAIREYQESVNLAVDGIVGPGTLGVLNRAAEDHESTILVNMERWRWMPKTLGDFYVRVNVPNFNLEIRRNEDVVHTTRIVVGKPKHATPIFSDEIEHVIVNPTWHVPASITRNELAPAARANRGALNGYMVYANIRGQFRRVDPAFVNWSSVDLSKIQIKQPPGQRNALGRVKFMFPNRHAVYLHDTPAKSLFKKDYRAYSHGCMRVHNPFEFADALLTADPDLTGELLRKRIGGREQQLNLDEHIPVHITYFTSWVDDAGELQIRGDVYGYDRRMKEALGLG